MTYLALAISVIALAVAGISAYICLLTLRTFLSLPMRFQEAHGVDEQAPTEKEAAETKEVEELKVGAYSEEAEAAYEKDMIEQGLWKPYQA